MKRFFVGLILAAGLLKGNVVVAHHIWKQVTGQPAAKNIIAKNISHYLVYSADETMLKDLLSRINLTGSGPAIELPLPDGSVRSFTVSKSTLLPPKLAAKYPAIQTYAAVATDDPKVTARLDFTSYGFHAMVFDGVNTSFIDPFNNDNTGIYIVHYKQNELPGTDRNTTCYVKSEGPVTEKQEVSLARKTATAIVNGSELRTYRIAISCNHQYAQKATGLLNPSIEQVLGKMVTSMNRINGVYERELSVTMAFVAEEDTLIWTTATGSKNGTDPFGPINDNADVCNTTNQSVCDARIGSANYDLGHVFTTGAGGYSQVGIVCRSGLKAQSCTGRPDPTGDGFDIDYVAHEIGHEFGANHPFNNGKDKSCGGANINPPTAYEPGSGSTIMAYAGICSPDNIQLHSDAYFHSVNLIEIQDFITGNGNACAVKTPTNNAPVTMASFTRSYNIPYLTPFELTAPTVADTSATYCWEQWNKGDVGARFADTRASGPIFRSYSPSKSPIRVFPRNELVLAGKLSDAGTDNAQGEKVPEVGRYLTFRLTVRNTRQGYGAILIPGDTILLSAVNTGAGFSVTSQSAAGNIYNGNSTQTITWNIAKTNEFPINTSAVDIFMSADGGNSWPYYIGNFINNGVANVTLPNPDTTITAARIKVKGADNVFFNVNSKNFTVVHSDAGDTVIKLYPIPVRNTLRVSSGNKGLLQLEVFNAIGQQVWTGQVNGELDIPVNNWAREVYIMRMIDVKNQITIKKFVVQ